MDRLSVPCEIKLAGDISLGLVEGYGAVYGNVDFHRDIIEPGAFTKSLALRRAEGRQLPPMRMQHGAMSGFDPRPVGVWTSMEEDSRGLKVQGRLAGLDTETGRYNLALVRDGAMRGLSIGYRVPAGTAQRDAKTGLRRLKSIHLDELSIVDDPSNPLATITEFKSATEISSAREFEAFLHDAGFSRAAAKAIAGGGWAALSKHTDDAEAAALIEFLANATAEIKGS